MEKDVEKLKCENVRLKDEVKNKLLLEEEVHDLKSRLTHYKEQEKRIAALQVIFRTIYLLFSYSCVSG